MMDLHGLFLWINDTIFAVPVTVLFLVSGLFMTLYTGVVQVRGLPRLVRLLTGGVRRKKRDDGAQMKTIGVFQALCTAMATTIGMGNLVGPSLAIIVGGPGALFWVLVYIFFGAALKFAEVTFALFTRKKLDDGYIVGGPVQYLKFVSPFLGYAYSFVMIFLFAGWSGVQSNTLASILVQEGVPEWITGLGLAVFLLFVLAGGAKRVGELATKLVPLMFILYLVAALSILLKDLSLLGSVIKLVFASALNPSASIGGFAGVSLLYAMRIGVERGIFITESGIGTAAIAHSMSDVEHPVEQGILTLATSTADFLISGMSGLLVMVTGVWLEGSFRSTLVYEAFKFNSPPLAQYVLIACFILFIITTVMGNGFNGVRTFGGLTKDRFVNWYIAFSVLIVFSGALLAVPLVWEAMGTFLFMASLINLIGILILSLRYRHVLKY